ncbi:tonsoku-like protein [Arctopsyche grandis]|uniref:tonsoku-like protein n=1 Tax=Arctopsyche grandis TaxID=121162 RepID=UPI00406DA089
MEEQKLRKRKSKALNSSNRKHLAEICTELGDFYNKKSEYEKALSEYKHGASVYAELKMKLENARSHRMIGEMYMLLAEFEKALKHEEIYLTLVKELNNKLEEQRALATLGRTYLLQGQSQDNSKESMKLFRLAERSFVKSLTLCESLKGKISNQELLDMKGRLLLNIGVVSEQLGDFDKAIDFFQKTINICKSQDLYDLLTQCYITEGLLYSSKHDDHTKAISCLNLALDVASRLENKVVKQCEILLLKSEALCKISDFQSAKNVLMKAWKMKTPNVDEREEIERYLKIVAALCYTEDLLVTTDSNDFSSLKKLYEKMGDGVCILKNYHKAIYFYLKMLDCAEKCGDTGKALIPIYVSLYQTYKDIKNYDKALEYNKKEYELIESIPKEAFVTLSSIADIMMLANKPYKEIEKVYEEAKQQALKTNNKKLELKCLKSLVKVQINFDLTELIQHTEREIATIEDVIQISDDSSEELCEDNETPNIGEDICLEDLTDLSDTEDNEINIKRTTRKRGKTFTIKKNSKGETQLHQACISGNVLLATRLLSQGHPVNIRDNAGWLPIHEACIHGHEAVVEVLIKNGANINDRGGTQCDGISPMYDAASNGHLRIIEILLDNGASPVIKTDGGDTPLNILIKWRESISVDPSDHIFYETLCSRMQNSLEKIGDSSYNTNKRNSTNKIHTSPLKTATYNSGSESEKSHSPIIAMKSRKIVSDDSSNSSCGSETFVSVPKKKAVAVKEYKSAISALRNRQTDGSSNFDVPRGKKKNALLSTQEVGEDWLDDDLPSLSKRRRKPSTEYVNPAKRRSSNIEPSPIKRQSGKFEPSPTKRQSNSVEPSPSKRQFDKFEPSSSKSFEVGNQEVNIPTLDLYDSDDSGSSFRSFDDENSRNLINKSDKISTSKLSKKFKRQASLLRIGFSRKMTDRPRFLSSNDFGYDPTIKGAEEPDSTTESVQSSPCSFNFNTAQTAGSSNKRINNEFGMSSMPQVPVAPITIRVKIQDKMLLIPVASEKINNLTVDWLIKETCRRFYKLEGIQPTINLLTSDGALLADDDPLSIILGSSELVANITNWNLPPLGSRYVECCSQFEMDIDEHIKHLLEKSQATHHLSFTGLNLDVTAIKPIFKALNHQTNLKHIVLCNNNIGNDGLMLLAQSLPTLMHIESLDLSGNLIDSNGVRHILSAFERANRPICEQLQSLNLSYNFLANQGFSYVIKLTNHIRLKRLYLKHADIECKSTDIMKESLNFQNMECLDLSYNCFDERILCWIFDRLNKSSINSLILEKLNVCTLLHESLDASLLINLNEINLSRCNITDLDINQLLRATSKYEKLEKIYLRYNSEITFITLKKLLSHRSFLHIDLEGCSCILKYCEDSDFQSILSSTDRSSKIEYLKISPSKSPENLRNVEMLASVWNDYWKDNSVVTRDLYNLVIFSKR